MSKFIYAVKAQPTKTIQGDIEAESEQEAINKLLQMGYFPIYIYPENFFDKRNLLYFQNISKREIAIFSRQLASLIESGVNIMNSLSIASYQNPNKYLKAILDDVAGKIKDGKSLSQSLATHSNIFSGFYTSIIHSGEASGNLQEVVKNLADFLEKEEEFKSSVRASLAYPIFVLIVGILTVVVLMGFVIPRLVTMFEDMEQSLPLATKTLIGISGVLRGWWWLILSLIFIFIFVLRRLYRTPNGRIAFSTFNLKLPFFGETILKNQTSHLMRTMSLLVSSGLPVVNSLEISSTVIENQVLRLEVGKFKEQIITGLSFSKCLGSSKLFSPFIANIIAVGEESGNLEKSLERISEEYEKDVERSLKALSRLLEPVIILVMGLIVGFIVLAMLLPIFQINLMVR